MLVRHFMTTEVTTLSPDESCFEALRQLRKRGVRRAPVLDRNHLVGIVSERDLLNILPGTIAQASTEPGKASMNIPVKRVMRSNVKTLHPNDHLESAARLMLTHKVGGVPVIHEGKLKGIITESDIFKALWGILSSETGCRIIFEDYDHAPKDLMDYIELCIKHRCQIHAFLRYPRPEGGSMYYICVEGEEIDELIGDLWTDSSMVISVERN